MTNPPDLPFHPCRLAGGIHREVTGRANEPLEFYLSVDRGLKSGRLDRVSLDEAQILRLIAEGAQALELIRRDSGRNEPEERDA